MPGSCPSSLSPKPKRIVVKEAMVTLSEALSIARSIEEDGERALALSDIALVQLDAANRP